MTRFVDVPTMSQLVHDIGIAQFIGDLAGAIRDDFINWPSFDKSARVASHSDLGVIELMPVSNAQRYAFKYVNGHPKNTQRGLYTVMAFGILADVETGYPVLLSELTVATALRTCATSLMAARALARPDSRRMALIGNGAQSEFQALAFHYHLGIEEIAVYDVDPLATEKLIRNLSAYPSLKIVRAYSTARSRAWRRYRHHGDRRQGLRDHSHPRHDRARHAHQWSRRGLSGEDRAACGRTQGRQGVR